jgi:hypothetical protein
MDEQVVLSLVLFSILDRMVLITERQREPFCPYSE